VFEGSDLVVNGDMGDAERRFSEVMHRESIAFRLTYVLKDPSLVLSPDEK